MRKRKVLAHILGIVLLLAGLILLAEFTLRPGITVDTVRRERYEIHTICLALDEYQDDFAVYPPSCVWWEGGRWYTAYADGRDTMDGAECLVHFLQGPDVRGFTVGDKTFGPYREFKRDSLIDVDNDGFKEAQDAFYRGCVYLYFKADTSRPAGSEYNPMDNKQILDTGGHLPDGSRIQPKPGAPVRDSRGRFRHPTAFQVISAGRDAQYNTKDDTTN